MRLKLLGVVLTASAVLTGCTVTRNPQLYPSNEAASSTGLLTAVMVGHGNLNGTITMTMPDGEVLDGRYSISMQGGMGFGSLYGSVYGTAGYASGSAYGSSMMVSSMGQGVADMIGPKGTTAHCEFLNNNFNGHGNGACRLSTGGVYRMQY
ncbi:MAG: hypothetical protein ACREHV_16875 [Rhizomicrobium sp.]